MTSKKTASLMDSLVDDLFSSYRSIFFDHKKREAQLEKLQQHILDKTLPPDLSFKIGEMQFPKSFSETAREQLLAAEREILDKAKLQILTARVDAHRSHVEELAAHLRLFSVRENIQTQCIQRIPALSANLPAIDAICKDVTFQISAFEAAQRPREGPPATAPHMEVSSGDNFSRQLEQMTTALQELTSKVSLLENKARLHPPATAASASSETKRGRPDPRNVSTSQHRRKPDRTRSATPGRGKSDKAPLRKK